MRSGTPLSAPAAASPASTSSVESAPSVIHAPRSTTKNFSAVTALLDTARSQAKAATESALLSATSTKIGSPVAASASLDTSSSTTSAQSAP